MMTNVTRVIVGALALGCFAGVGCSSDNDSSGGGSGSITGLPSGKKLGDLTEEEATKACENSEAVLDAIDDARADCVVGAQFGLDQVTLEACEEYVTSCLADDKPAAGGTSSQGTSTAAECATAAADLVGCDATVSELEGCLRDSTAAINDFVAGYTCENLAADTLPELSKDGPASCMRLTEKCPKLFEGEDSTSGSGGGNTGTGGPEQG